MVKEKFWICLKKRKGTRYTSVYKASWNNLEDAISYLKNEVKPVWKRKLYAVCNSDKTEILYSQEE